MKKKKIITVKPFIFRDRLVKSGTGLNPVKSRAESTAQFGPCSIFHQSVLISNGGGLVVTIDTSYTSEKDFKNVNCSHNCLSPVISKKKM